MSDIFTRHNADQLASSSSSSVLQEISRQRDIKLLRDTLSMLCNVVWHGTTRPGEHLWSIPVDEQRDFDCIFSDAIDELEKLREQQRHAQAEIEGLQQRFDLLHQFLDTLLCEECCGTGLTGNHDTGTVACSSCEGTGHDVRKAKAVVEAAEARAEAAEGAIDRALTALDSGMDELKLGSIGLALLDAKNALGLPQNNYARRLLVREGTTPPPPRRAPRAKFEELQKKADAIERGREPEDG